MIQIHNQKGAVWNDKLLEYIILDVGGSGTVICILTTIYMHISRFMCSVHT